MPRPRSKKSVKQTECPTRSCCTPIDKWKPLGESSIDQLQHGLTCCWDVNSIVKPTKRKQYSLLQLTVQCRDRGRAMACLKILLDAGADCNLPVPEGTFPALQIALRQDVDDHSRTLEMTELLLQNGADPNMYSNPDDITEKLYMKLTNGHETPLSLLGYVLQEGGSLGKELRLALVKLLVKYKVNINKHVNLRKDPPILIAIQNHCQSELDVLIEAGANLNLTRTYFPSDNVKYLLEEALEQVALSKVQENNVDRGDSVGILKTLIRAGETVTERAMLKAIDIFWPMENEYNDFDEEIPFNENDGKEILTLMLEHNSNPNDVLGCDLEHRKKRDEVLEIAYVHGMNLDVQRAGFDIFEEARRDANFARWIIRHGAGTKHLKCEMFGSPAFTADGLDGERCVSFWNAEVLLVLLQVDMLLPRYMANNFERLQATIEATPRYKSQDLHRHWKHVFQSMQADFSCHYLENDSNDDETDEDNYDEYDGYDEFNNDEDNNEEEENDDGDNDNGSEKPIKEVEHCNKLTQMEDLLSFSDDSLSAYPEPKSVQTVADVSQLIGKVLQIDATQTLQWWCRRVIRHSMISLSPSVVKNLQVPNFAKRYLLCHEV